MCAGSDYGDFHLLECNAI